MLPLFVMGFIAGGLVATAAFAMCILLPVNALGYNLSLGGKLGTTIFLFGGALGIIQITRNKPDQDNT